MRRRNNRGDIIIDLTSLLDVIFIILLVVILGTYKERVDLHTAQEDLEKEMGSYSREIKRLDDIADSTKYVCFVSVSVPYTKDEPTQRKIEATYTGKEDDKIDIIGHMDEEGFEVFEERITKYIEECGEKPIVVSLDEDESNILYRDEQKMNELINNLSSKYGNVYIKSNMREEKE